MDKIDADKPKTEPTNLSKVSNVVKNDVPENTTYDELDENVNIIDWNKHLLWPKSSIG